MPQAAPCWGACGLGCPTGRISRLGAQRPGGRRSCMRFTSVSIMMAYGWYAWETRLVSKKTNGVVLFSSTALSLYIAANPQDMNEVSNFQSDPHPYDACFLPAAPNVDLQCYTMDQLARNYSFSEAQRRAVNPPYAVNNARHSAALGTHTMSPAAQRIDGNLEYNTHQLYGLSQVAATFAALQHITPGRPFVLTRSSFLGMCMWVGVCTGCSCQHCYENVFQCKKAFSVCMVPSPQSATHVRPNCQVLGNMPPHGTGTPTPAGAT